MSVDEEYADHAVALAPEIQRSLLAWYDVNKRDLPWRRTRDPYAIWIAEVMCQQTQVATVIPYWNRWMAAFPDAETLAGTDFDEVLSYWAGLGYYRRARMIHQAAQVIAAAGEPTDSKGWRALPGVGKYTAGAIASIAHGESTAVVDGNVDRVVSRVFAVGAHESAGRREKLVWKLAERLVSAARPGDFNQALMELGAVMCSPQNPSCDECPIATHCAACARDDVASYPPHKPKTKVSQQRMRLLAVESDGVFALVQRPLDGLHGGLWEFPSATPDEFDALLERFGHKAADRVGEFVHVFSHIRMTYEVFRIETKTRLPAMTGMTWTVPSSKALSVAMRKAFALLRK